MHPTLIDRTHAFLASLSSPALVSFLADWPDTDEQREVVPSSLPVLRWFPQANTAAPVAALVASLRNAAPHMAWRQTYSTGVEPTFLDNYGWTELAGLAGPVPSERIACGFMLLGPATTYPPHRHEAEEIYIPLVGTALWQQGDGTWHERTPGSVIHHARHEPHAMQTGKAPLLAVYLWRSTDLNQKARFDPPRQPQGNSMDPSIISAAGIRMPRILYGTAWKKADTERLVALAIREGFRGIDTACQPKHYDEAGVGAGVAACLASGLERGDLYLQTKFTSLSGQDPQRIPYDRDASLSQQVAQSFEVSLRNLQTNRLDGLVLHSPLPSTAQTLEVWRAMESLVDAGGVGQLGISNCYTLETLEALYDAARIKPAIVQNRFYADTRYDRELRAYCRMRHIVYQSFWTLSANPHVLTHATITTLAAKYERTAAQVLFRYLTQIDVVPLTGTRSEIHMREDLGIFQFTLTASEREALERLF